MPTPSAPGLAKPNFGEPAAAEATVQDASVSKVGSVADSSPVVEPEPISDPGPKTDPGPTGDSGPVVDPGPVVEPEPRPEPVIKPGPEPVIEPAIKPGPEPVVEPERGPVVPVSPAPAPEGSGSDLAQPDAAEQLHEEVEAELAAQAPEPAARPRRPEGPEWRGIVLVTGTDTDVGKTIVTAAIAAAAQAAGLRVAVIKPGQTGTTLGGPTDVEQVQRLAAPHTARTLATYPDPLAPLAAAKVAELPPLELYEVVDAVRAEAERHDLVLVEGAGGLLVPMGVRPSGEAWTFADLATTLGVSTVVVARAGLGTLNHTALTLEALARRGVPAGVVLGAWPAEPELVHWANLSELVPHLVGALPDGAGGMEPGVFRRSAPGWLTPALHGVIDNWRTWADEVH